MTQEIFKIMIFLKRKPGLSLEEFRDYYENHHMPLCSKYLNGVRRYFRRYIQTMTDETTGVPQELDFDVVTEIWFDDRKTFETALKYAGRGILPADVIADEERVFDRPKSRFTWVIEHETDLAAL